MTNKINDFVKTNLLKILGVVFLLAGFYLDNTYVNISKHKTTQRELDTLKVKLRLFQDKVENKEIGRDKDFTRLEERFEKKIKIINQHTKDIDNNENNIIRLQNKK